MGKYMVSKGLDKGSKVSEFKLVNVPFAWQGVGYSAMDCGTYLMIHMLLYAGKPFDHGGLGSVEGMNLYRAEIAAILALSDINQSRQDVLNAAKTFKDGKLIDTAASSKTGSFKTPAQSTAPKRSRDNNTGQSAKRPRLSKSSLKTPDAKGNVVNSPESGLSAIRSRTRGKGDGLGCSLNCGVVDLTTLVISKTLRNNQSILKDVPNLRKHVADYCFFDENEIYEIDPR